MNKVYVLMYSFDNGQLGERVDQIVGIFKSREAAIVAAKREVPLCLAPTVIVEDDTDDDRPESILYVMEQPLLG